MTKIPLTDEGFLATAERLRAQYQIEIAGDKGTSRSLGEG